MDYLIILLVAGVLVFFFRGGGRRRRGVYVNIYTTFLIFFLKRDTQEHLVESLGLVLWSI